MVETQSIDWHIDKSKPIKMLFLIKKGVDRYYGYNSHGQILDVCTKPTMIAVTYRNKRYYYTFGLKHSKGYGGGVMWYDMPIVKQVNSKIEGGKVENYNWE